MQRWGRLKPKVFHIFGGIATVLWLLGTACGGAATAIPPPTDSPAPPGGQTGVPTPTAAPTATLAPAESVHPGKVTWLVGSFHNERFDYTFTGGHDYARIVHGFLISSDVEGERRVATPGIASKWEISSDGLTWTFTIREGAKFHDGTDLTTADVLWTLQHIMGPQAVEYAGSGPIALARNMDRIEQTGPNQVSLFTKGIATEIPERVGEAGGGWYGAILPKRATLHNEEEEAAYDRNPIGAGPMRLVRHVPGDLMAFERFADFYQQPDYGYSTDKRVNFAELDLRLVPEEATRVAALRGGEADFGAVSLGARGQVEAGGGRLIFGSEGVTFHILQMGCWNPQYPCHDIRVRQALNYAVNKEIIQNQLYGGPKVLQVKGWAYVGPSAIGYSPELAPYPFDPDKARQLLADAGYPGGQGFGTLVLNTYQTPAFPLMPESAQLVAEMWKRELGLDVEVNIGDQGALSASMQAGEHYGEIWFRDNETRIDASGNIRVFWGSPERQLRMHDDPELYAAVEEALAVVDPAEQQNALNGLYRRLQDEAYWISLGYLNIPWGVGPRVAAWQPYPLATYPSGLHTIVLK